MDTSGNGKNVKESIEEDLKLPLEEHPRRLRFPELMTTLRRFELLGDGLSHTRAERLAADATEEDAKVREVLGQITVVAFVGPSGTGKSTRAIQVARKNNIHFLIDDGLLINGGKILAGTSAKRAPTKLESVRQALFEDATRSSVMRRALLDQLPTTLMILGTSDAMLQKICTNLWLHQPAMLIRIEDISTEEEMQLAKRTRITEGMHTIPVPSMEIKHEFSGYFSDPLNRLRRRLDRERGIATFAPDTERTVVRPTFSSLGSYSISDEALYDLVCIILKNIDGIHEVSDFKAEKRVYGEVLSLDLTLIYGYNAQTVLKEAQERISRYAEEYTSVNIVAVDVRAKRLVHDHDQKSKDEVIAG